MPTVKEFKKIHFAMKLYTDGGSTWTDTTIEEKDRKPLRTTPRVGDGKFAFNIETGEKFEPTLNFNEIRYSIFCVK